MLFCSNVRTITFDKPLSASTPHSPAPTAAATLVPTLQATNAAGATADGLLPPDPTATTMSDAFLQSTSTAVAVPQSFLPPTSTAGTVADSLLSSAPTADQTAPPVAAGVQRHSPSLSQIHTNYTQSLASHQTRDADMPSQAALDSDTELILHSRRPFEGKGEQQQSNAAAFLDDIISQADRGTLFKGSATLHHTSGNC